MHMYMHTCVGTSYVPTNTQADIQTYRQAGRHTAIQTFIIQRGRQTDTHTGCVYFCACWGSCCTHGAGLLADHRLSCLGGCSVSHDVFHFFIRFKNNFRILQDISVFFSCVGSVVGVYGFLVELLGKSFVQVGILGDYSRFRLVGLVGQTLLLIELGGHVPCSSKFRKLMCLRQRAAGQSGLANPAFPADLRCYF